MSSPSKTTPVAAPLSAYMPFPNFDSPTQAIPIHEMPWPSEARYQLLSDSEKAALRPQTRAAESRPIQTTKSINGHHPARADSERWSSWSWSSLNPLSRSISKKPPTKCEDEYKKIKHDEADDLAPGIPTLAAILNKSFGLYRVFLPEANQILLRRIIEISKLVKELREHDANVITEDECKLYTFEIEDESDRARAKLLERIEKEIYDFYDFFEKFVNIKALAGPSERTHADLHNWMIYNRPLLEGEDDFIYHISDLVSARQRNEYSSQQGNRLDDLITTYLAGKPGSFIDRMFAQKDNTVKFGVTQYKDSRLAIGRVILSVVLTVSLLLAPIFILFLIDMPRVAMVSTVFGFVVLFTVVVALLAEGRPVEVLVGTAAYGAILAAFLGNLGGMNQCFVPTT